MNISIVKKTFSSLSKPSMVAPVSFIAIGAAKTISDYKKAEHKHKKAVLLTDVSMLAGSIMSYALIYPITQKFCKTGFIKTSLKILGLLLSKICKKRISTGKVLNGTRKALEHTEHIVKESTAATINTCAGIMGAVGANELVQRYAFTKEGNLKEIFDFPNRLFGNNENKDVVKSLNDVDLVGFSEQENKESSLQNLADNLSVNNEKEVSSEPLPKLTTDDTSEQDEKDITKYAETTIDSIDLNLLKNGYFKNTRVFDKFDYATPKILKDTSNRVFSTFTDVPEMKFFSAPMIALTGFSVAKTDGFKNKIKKMSYELMANTFIPTVFITAVSIAFENKKSLLKYPALLLSLIAGSYTGKAVADKVNDKLNEKIDKFK